MNTIAFALAEGLVLSPNASTVMPFLFPGIWLGYELSEFILKWMHIPSDFGLSLTITFITTVATAVAVNTCILYVLTTVFWRIRQKSQAS